MLDPRTLMILLVLACFVAGLGLPGLPVPQERRPSLRRWAAGNLLAGAGLLLIALREHLPPWPPAVLGNTLVLAGPVLCYQSICLLVQKPFRPLAHLAAVLAAAALFQLLFLHAPAPHYRLAAVGGLMALVFCAIALALRHLESRAIARARRLMTGLYGLAAAGALAHALHTLQAGARADLLAEPPPLEVLSLAAFALALTGSNVLYLLMQNGLAYYELGLMASRDLLTGVHNRRHFLEMAGRDWALAQRMGRPLSVLMLAPERLADLDRRLGRLAGDEVLRRFGDTVRDAVREVDLVCRYEGRTFCILMADTAPAVARRSAERLRRELAALEMHVDGRQVPLTVSIGVAGVEQVGEGQSLEGLLAAARRALTAAQAAEPHVAVLDPLAA